MVFPMSKNPLLALMSVLLATAAMLPAQTPSPTPQAPTDEKTVDSPGPNRFWQATLPGGHYMVALDRISSVSRHQYVLDGTLIVDEVTVDSLGQALARFYFITPITDAMNANAATQLASRGKELIDKAAQRAGTGVQDMVMKKYPDTTHARTIEYRLLSEQELGSLYSSVRSSWETGRGRKFATK
jgi:hypothetical protein